MDSFKQYVRNYFEFLYQFNYRILEESSDNIVSFQGESNRLDVEFSEIGYEITCQFIDEENKNFSLQDAILYMSIGEYKGLYQVSNRAEIEKGVIYLSKVIKILFDKIDVSNHLNFDKIFLFKVETHEKALKDYYLKTDIKRAEEFWERKEYTKAEELFNKHKEFLTKSQFQKLEYIQNHIQKRIFKSGTPVVEPEMLDIFNKSIISIEHAFKADIEAMFEFEGFRKGKIFKGYRPSHLIKEGYLTTGVHDYYDLDDNSGEKIMGTISFISPEEYPKCLWKGKKIAMYEGSKLVGYATVTKIFNPILVASENVIN